VSPKIKNQKWEEVTESSPYLKAAAVLTSYDPETIRPVGGASPEELKQSFQELISRSTVTYNRHAEAVWSLRGDIRRGVLHSLKDRRAMAACLKANPRRPKTGLQKMFERYLRDEAPAVSELSSYQLSHTLQVVDWLGGILPGLPEREALRDRMEWDALLAPFRFLVDEHFSGRKEELRRLHDYVGVLETDSILSAISRTFRQVFNLKEKPPLLIYGPGGIGKSTLLAKFILNHATANKDKHIPFAYLDLDRPSLWAREPVALLAEIAQQLSVQYPEARQVFIATQNAILAELTRVARSSGVPSKGAGPTQWRVSQIARDGFLEDFGRMVTSTVGLNKPLLLVLDTFERVQFRSQDQIDDLWEFLNALQKQVPQLRTVIGGRAPMDRLRKLPVDEVPVPEFDQPSAEAYLKSHKISDPTMTRSIIQQVGRNPLSLKLAVEVIAGERNESAIAELVPKRVNERLIQGILYRRILRHISEEDVRRLAHPGLILRRITPELIQQVLAEPCGVEVPDYERAQELFDKLKREVSVVAPSEDGSLRHRQDLRQLMIRLLTADEPQRVEDIQRRAIAFYSGSDEPVSRAEEIYHRLALGEDAKSVSPLWLPGVEQYLAGPWDELSAAAQTFLAARTKFELSETVWRVADPQSGERRAARRAEEFLAKGSPEKAWEVARAYKARSPLSPLFALEGRALFQLREFEQSRKCVRRGIGSFSEAGKTVPLDLLLLDSELDCCISLDDSPEDRVRSFREAVRRYPGDIRLLKIGLNLLIAFQSQSVPPDSVAESSRDLTRLKIRLTPVEAWSRRLQIVRQELQEELIGCLRTTKPETLEAEPDLSRRLFAEIGLVDPAITMGLIRRTGLGGELVAYVVPQLAEFLSAWDAALSATGSPESTIASSAGLQLSDSSPGTWLAHLEKREPPEIAQLVDAALEKRNLPDEVFRLLVYLLKRAFQRRDRYGKPN
jgi:cellulose synthase operon protein C